MPKKATYLGDITPDEAERLCDYLSVSVSRKNCATLERRDALRIDQQSVSFRIPTLTPGHNLSPALWDRLREISTMVENAGKRAQGQRPYPIGENPLIQIIPRHYKEMKARVGTGGIVSLRRVEALGRFCLGDVLPIGLFDNTYVSLDEPLWLERANGVHQIVPPLEPFRACINHTLRIAEPFTVLGFGAGGNFNPTL